MTAIYLIELVGLQPASAGGAIETLYWSTGTGYTSGPAETPANTVYAPRILSPGSYERHMWQPGATRGQGTVNIGVVEIANADGALDKLINYDFDGRAITLLRGDPLAPRASFVTVFRGTAEQLLVTESTVTVRIRDRRAEVSDKPLVPFHYTGTNVLPDGLDGTPDDLKGQSVPIVYGICENFKPPRVNSSKLIYQFSAYGLDEVTGVFEGGNAITPGVSRASLAALVATAPAAGTYDYYLGTAYYWSYLRLGSTPSLEITATCKDYGGSSGRTAGNLIQWILTYIGVASGDVLGKAALDAVAPYELGLYIATGAEAKVGDTLDQICASVGASWTPNRLGQFNILRLQAPVGPAVVTFRDDQLLASSGTVLTLQPTEDPARGIPCYELRLGYAKISTVQEASSLAGIVTAARRDYLAQEYRQVVVTNAGIWDPSTFTGRNPLSQPMVVNTLIRSVTDATTEANRLLAIYGTRHPFVCFTVSSDLATAIDLGVTISLATDRFGLNGKLLMVTGMIEDFSSNQTTIYAWG
jgi:hypothetical protein